LRCNKRFERIAVHRFPGDALVHDHRHFFHPKTGKMQHNQRVCVGIIAGVILLAEETHHIPVHGLKTRGGVGDGLPGECVGDGGEHPHAHAAHKRGAIGHFPREAGPQRHVTRVRHDGGQQMGNRGGIMLAVRIHHHGVIVAKFSAVAKTGLHCAAIAQIIGQSHHASAQRPGHDSGVIG